MANSIYIDHSHVEKYESKCRNCKQLPYVRKVMMYTDNAGTYRITLSTKSLPGFIRGAIHEGRIRIDSISRDPNYPEYVYCEFYVSYQVEGPENTTIV